MVTVPEAFPLEFRRDVVAVACRREAPMSQIAKDFAISKSCPSALLFCSPSHPD
jgi:transposase